MINSDVQYLILILRIFYFDLLKRSLSVGVLFCSYRAPKLCTFFCTPSMCFFFWAQIGFTPSSREYLCSPFALFEMLQVVIFCCISPLPYCRCCKSLFPVAPPRFWRKIEPEAYLGYPDDGYPDQGDLDRRDPDRGDPNWGDPDRGGPRPHIVVMY